MSNRLFQGIIHQVSESIHRMVGVVDGNSEIIACSEAGRLGEPFPGVLAPVFESECAQAVGQFTLCKLQGAPGNSFAVFIDGDDEAAAGYAALCAVTLGSVEQFVGERFDRSNFIKNVILDNILPGDVYLRTRELHFNNEAPRAVLLIRIAECCEISVIDTMHSLFPDQAKDFVISVNETDIALVKEVRPNTDARDLEKLARSIADAVSTEYHSQPAIGVGSVVLAIPELATSYKEAQVSLEVGKVFDTEKKIISYDYLGIARLIYQLPKRLCGMFLQEVFKRGTIDTLDQETLFTIQKFFENNLNVSETSRKLFVHRNTLVYRLEKIKKLTGLDLREFDDAIVFKVALMVKKYLDAKPTRY
jgi:carbohydrate diacid regulator